MAKEKVFKRNVQNKVPEKVDVKFNVDGNLEGYRSFIEDLCMKLGNHKDTDSMSCFQKSEKSEWRKPDHILLPKQTAPEPARWILIKLSTKDEEHKTTLFVRDDNVYLVGFENEKGQKYQAGKVPSYQILEGGIALRYDFSYKGLGDDSSKWDLKQSSIQEAVIKLATYGTKPKSNKEQECIKKYLARLILMICEAARMYRIMTAAEKGWSSNDGVVLTRGGSRSQAWGMRPKSHCSMSLEGGPWQAAGLAQPLVLTTLERETLNKWVHISQAMMGWGKYTLGLKNIKVKNDKDASSVVRLIKYAPMRIKPGDGNGDAPPGDGNGDAPPGDGNGDETSPGNGNGHGSLPGGGSDDGTSPVGGNGDPPSADRNGNSQQRRQHQGRSLVEVSSIHLTKGCTLPDVGSITVFDGKRGQVIYGDAPRVDSEGNLVLTGPYRAISADGMVALRITTVSKSAEDELLIWDPYSDDHYDELVSGAITEDLTLTYTVLRSAVEATVQVDLFFFEETDFYGEITAQSKLASGEQVSVVLFSREIMELKPSSAGSTIPLTRSVLAWAVGSELLIKVDIFHSVWLSLHRLHLRAERSLEGQFSFDDHSDKVRFAPLGGFGYIRVSVDDTGEYREKPHNNSLPRSWDQLGRDQTLAAEQNDLTRMGILEHETGAQDSMDPEDIGTRPKLLVVRISQLRLITKFGVACTCLLHLTNDSDDQHVAFRCRSVLGDRRHRRVGDHRHWLVLEESLLAHSSDRNLKWELSGIVPPNSTSTYLVRPETEYAEVNSHSLILESCGLEKVTQSATISEPADEATTSEQAEGDVGLDTIFREAKERIEKVKLTLSDLVDKTTTSEQEEGDDDLHAFFSRPSKGIKEVTIKGTVSHPADVTMTSETEIKVPITESSINQNDLDVYPLQLRFPFEQDKVSCCPLRLTNRTNDYVIFKCLPLAPTSCLYKLDHLNGVLPPRSTCTYVVATEKQKDLPDNMDELSMILKSCTAEEITGTNKYISRQDPMPGPIPPRIEIITVTGKDYEILSMDVHPTEPWILASHFNGNVSIWNYQTEARVMELELTVPDSRQSSYCRCIYSAKFIAAEKWIVAGGGNGVIYMVEYMTKEVKKFQAHRNSVESLAVHPNKPFVLSASYDATIKLWNWDVNRDPIWQNTRTFSTHLQVVNYVMFNPYDNGNTFASASDDFTVKIWSTNDPNDQPKPIATLNCGKVQPQHVAYYSMGGRQYMITGSLKGAARVWDLEKPNKHIKELDGLAKEKKSGDSKYYGCNVDVLNCVPDDTNPVLITVSEDMGISFLDATTYKPRYDKVNFGLGVAMGFAVIDVKGKRSLAIALREGIAIMEMNEDQVNSPATVEQAQEGIYSAESSNDQ